MLDPITAASLAASVISIVDFGLKTVAKCYETYKDGSTKENDALESARQSLPSLLEELETQLKKSAKAGPLNQQEQELVDVAQKCRTEAESLQGVLTSLKESPRKKWTHALAKGVRAVANKSKIKGIESNLSRYNDTLQTHLLVNLNEKQGISLEQIETLNKDMMLRLDLNNRGTINEIENQSHSVMQHVTETVQNQLLRAEAPADKLLASLQFPEIRRGRENISEVHLQTCQWIFKGDKQVKRRWDDFSKWLAQGTDIYWIQGKAGSGKSTLMNFICDHEETSRLLASGNNDTPVATPTFFFWNSGTYLQKSTEGLLRSLMFQILDSDPGLRSNDLVTSELCKIQAWNEPTLRRALLTLLENTDKSFCIFVDGLDEFSGDWLALVDLLRKLCSYNHVKACVSSRPENAFQVSFRDQPSLCIQDFTHSDMSTYIRDKLSSFPFTASAQVNTSVDFYKLTDLVQKKADGVWRWVSFAASSLIDGRINCDSFDQLRMRLQELPSDLEELYADMLGRVRPSYKDLSQKILQRVLVAYNIMDEFRDLSSYMFRLSILDLAYDDIQQRLEGDQEACYELDALLNIFESIISQWNAACMGLIEFSLLSWPPDLSRNSFAYYEHLKVQFTHLTVRAFVEKYTSETFSGSSLSQQDTPGASLIQMVVRSCLWKSKLADTLNEMGYDTVLVRSHQLNKVASVILNSELFGLVHLRPELNILLQAFDHYHATKAFQRVQLGDLEAEWFGYLCYKRAYKYIMHRFEDYVCPPTVAAAGKASYLLGCVINFYDHHGSKEESGILNITQFFFDRGADANRDFRDTGFRHPWGSAWETLLGRATAIKLNPELRKDSVEFPFGLVQMFLNNSANPHALGSASLNLGALADFTSLFVRIDVSPWVALYPVSPWLNVKSLERLSALHREVEARGGKSSARYLQMAVTKLNGTTLPIRHLSPLWRDSWTEQILCLDHSSPADYRETRDRISRQGHRILWSNSMLFLHRQIATEMIASEAAELHSRIFVHKVNNVAVNLWFKHADVREMHLRYDLWEFG